MSVRGPARLALGLRQALARQRTLMTAFWTQLVSMLRRSGRCGGALVYRPACGLIARARRGGRGAARCSILAGGGGRFDRRHAADGRAVPPQ